MSKSSPLNSSDMFPADPSSIAPSTERNKELLSDWAKRQQYAEMHKKDPFISPKTGKPYRKQSPLQTLSTELNWDLAQLKGASETLQRLARKYNMVIPKILFKNVHAADLIAGVEKELKERVKESRVTRTAKLKEPAPVDNAPPLG